MITAKFDFASMPKTDVERLGQLAALDVTHDGLVLIAEMDPDTINPIDAIWLQGLAAAYEVMPETTVETPAA